MLILKVAFSLITNINQSACSSLHWANQNWLSLYKHQWRFPINKNTTPMYTCLINCIIMLASCCVTPMSICPISNNNLCVCHSLGWVCYAEKSHGEYILPHISNVKSPQQIMGSIVKVWYEMLCNYEVACVRSFFLDIKSCGWPLSCIIRLSSHTQNRLADHCILRIVVCNGWLCLFQFLGGE